jgi:nucleoside-diphosphate-sugar epimerase
MNVLVTGATGFLGGALCPMLISKGFNVRGAGRNRRAGDELAAKGVTFVPADLRSEREAAELCRDMDYVIHCAALSSPWGRRKDFIQANVNATRHLTDAAVRHRVRKFVHISSSSVYFDFTDRYDVCEQAALARPFASCYTETKYLSELEVARAADSGLSIAILRPRGIFGPGDPSIIPRLIQAHKRGILRVVGDSNTLVDMTYVDNIAHAAFLAMCCPESPKDPVFNITNDEPVRLWDFINNIMEGVGLSKVSRRIPYPIAHSLAYLAEILAKTVMVGREPPLTRYTVGLLAKSQTLDITKAKSLLGYAPIVSIAEGIANVVAWLKTAPAEAIRVR